MYEFFFTINSDFDRPEQRGHGAKVPGSEMARERKGQGASWPGSESARVLLADSLRGAIGLGAKRLGTNCPVGEMSRRRSVQLPYTVKSTISCNLQ